MIIILPCNETNDNVYRHTSGNFTLTIIGSLKFGLPYGPLPRLLYVSIINEVKRTKSPVLRFGKMYLQLLRILQVSKRVDKHNYEMSLYAQMLRFFSANISCSIQKNDENKCIRHKFNFWWNPFQGNKENITSSSTIVLEKFFYDELINFPFSIDINIIKNISYSSMFIDIFFWIIQEISVSKGEEIYISWAQILNQFNSNHIINIAFKKQIIQGFYTVLEFFPNLNITIREDGFILTSNQSYVGMVQSDQNFDVASNAVCSIIHVSSGGK